MKRSPMRRSSRPVGAAAKLRRARGGARAAGRDSLPVSEWQILKAALYHRARGRCESPLCRKAGVLDPHHVIKTGQGGEDTAENIVMLCRNCHDATDLSSESNLRLGIVKLEALPETWVFFYPDGDEAAYTRPPAEPNYPTKG